MCVEKYFSKVAVRCFYQPPPPPRREDTVYLKYETFTISNNNGVFTARFIKHNEEENLYSKTL